MGASADPFAELEQQHVAATTDPFADIEAAHRAGQIPAPVSAAGRLPRGAWDPGHDVLENLSDQAEDIGGQVGRNIGGLVTAVGQKAKDVWHLIQHPSTIMDEPMQTPEEQMPHLRDLPVIGPLSEGRYGAAVGDVATGALLGKLGGGEAEAGAESGLPSLLQPRTLAEANFLQSSKPLAEIINSSKKAGRFQDETLRTAMPIIQKEAREYGDTGKIDSYDKLSGLTDSAYNKHVAAYQQYLNRAKDAVIDRTAAKIPETMIKAIPTNIRINEPELYNELVTEAYKHGGPVKISDLDTMRQENNADLHKFESATGSDKNAVLRSSAATAMLKAEQLASKDALYRTIDPESEGQNVAEINRRLGSLIEMKDGLTDLNDRMIRQNDPNAVQKMTQHAKDVIHATLSPSTGIPAAAFKKLMAEPDVNGKIANAFRNYKGQDLPDVPSPITRAALPPGATRVPPTDTTRVNITTGAPLEQSEPLTLHKTGPGTFEWQRNLFPEHKEGHTFERPTKPSRVPMESQPIRVKKPPTKSDQGNASATPPNVENESPWRY